MGIQVLRLNLCPVSPQSKRTIWKWNFCGNHVWTIRRQWANWFGCNHLGTETGWDLLSGPCGVRLIFNSITRNVKQCLKALAKSPEAPSGAFDVLGVDVVIFWNLGRNIFLIATVSRFSVECGCVFCVLNVSVRTVIHTDRSFAENLSSAILLSFTSKTHLSGNRLIGSVKHEEVYKDLVL